MPQTRLGFVFMLGFDHNFSITSPKEISCKFFTVLSKTQRILIIEHYLHSNYETKMSNTFTFNRTEFVPICQNKTVEFLHKFLNDRFVSIGLWPPQSPDVNPLDFFLLGHLKNKIFATPPATIEELK